MSREQIVFFDIDGTLLNEDKELPESTVIAIKDLQDKGIVTAIATGRAPFMFRGLLKKLNINTFVSFNGQYVVYKGKPLFQNPLDAEELERLERISEKSGHPMAFLSNDGMAVNQENHHYVKDSFGDLKITAPEADRDFKNNHSIFQALLFSEETDDMSYLEGFKSFDYIRWHTYSADIIPKGGSKAEGIKHLLEKAGISQKNTFAFGDALNDIQMLQYVACGIAMGNGKQEAKKAADLITDSVDENGILNGLKKVGLL